MCNASASIDGMGLDSAGRATNDLSCQTDTVPLLLAHADGQHLWPSHTSPQPLGEPHLLYDGVGSAFEEQQS
jgi:hypothetical protein